MYVLFGKRYHMHHMLTNVAVTESMHYSSKVEKHLLPGKSGSLAGRLVLDYVSSFVFRWMAWDQFVTCMVLMVTALATSLWLVAKQQKISYE